MAEEQPAVEITTVLPRWQLWLRRRRRPLLIGGAALLVAVAGIALAVWLLWPRSFCPGADPVTAVRGFMDATTTLDDRRVLSYIAPQSKPEQVLAEIQMSLGQIRQLEYRDARIELLNNDGQVAHVVLSATLCYELERGGAQEVPLHVTITLVLQDHCWYILNLKP